MNLNPRVPLLVSLALLAVVNVGCEGLGPAAIDAVRSELAESEREEKEEQRRAEERRRTPARLKLLEERRRTLEAGFQAVNDLVVRREDDLKQARQRWRALRKAVLAEIPTDCRPKKLSSDPDRRAFQQEVYAPRWKALAALEQRVRDLRAPATRLLIQKGIAGKAPRWTRTFLFGEYNQRVNTRDPELEALAREVAALYDADLLARFRRYGGYGKTGPTPQRVGCVFSTQPWPEALTSVEPRFTTHFTGKAVVHVLGRLPLPARRYGGRVGGELSVQLISDQHGVVDVGESVSLGQPETLGDARTVRAAFEVPPRRFDHTRFFFDVRVVHTWEDARGRHRTRVLSQSSFSWQAEPPPTPEATGK